MALIRIFHSLGNHGRKTAELTFFVGYASKSAEEPTFYASSEAEAVAIAKSVFADFDETDPMAVWRDGSFIVNDWYFVDID